MRLDGWYIFAALVIVALLAWHWMQPSAAVYAGGAVGDEAHAIAKGRAACNDGNETFPAGAWHAQLRSGVWVAYANSSPAANGHPKSGLWVRVDAETGDTGRCERWTQ